MKAREEKRDVVPHCWICCVRLAQSKEHKFKASDLRRSFGKGDWSKENQPVHGRDGEPMTSIRGPGSSRMTYGPVLCEQCNNRDSQPFDLAYDAFITWVLANKDEVLRDRRIDFSVVFGEHWQESQLNLFRYFTKHFGCNIAATEGHQVPHDLRDILHQASFRTAFRVTFHVHEDILLAPGLDEGLMLGPLGHLPPEEFGIPSYWSHIIVHWLMVCYWYNIEIPNTDAIPWIANMQAVNLGGHAPLSDEERQELKRKAAGFLSPNDSQGDM